jgi:hypothetical protein
VLEPGIASVFASARPDHGVRTVVLDGQSTGFDSLACCRRGYEAMDPFETDLRGW